MNPPMDGRMRFAPETVAADPMFVNLEAPEDVETPQKSEPTVRGARPEDVEALTTVELSAYRHVYGDNPTTDEVDRIRQKFAERVETLGSYVRVIETPEDGVYGMIVCCPTSLERSDFLESDLDLTEIDSTGKVYDPSGKNGYIFNLAIRGDKQGAGDSARLFKDAIDVGIETGVERTFFESRLPGFDRWLRKNGHDDPSKEQLDELSEQYWTSTRMIRGETKPIDPLLRSYVNFGAAPLKLVKDAWSVDAPSRGYGVLCEYELPTREVAETMPPPPEKEDSQTMDGPEHYVAEVEGEPVQAVSFFKRALEWVKAEKGKIALGSALASMALTTVTDAPHEIIEHVSENAPWVAMTYGASMATYVGSGALMLAAAGRKVQNVFAINKELPAIAEHARTSVGVRTGFWLNTGSALTAAGVASAGIVESLPPSAWGALAIPALDIYSTVVLRKWLHGKIGRKR